MTHDQWEAMTLATTIAVMSQGRLQQVGSPNAIYDRPANRFVAQFVGNPPINMIDLDAGTPVAAAARRVLGARAPAGGAVGIRPEAIRLDAAAEGFAGPAEVTGVLPTTSRRRSGRAHGCASRPGRRRCMSSTATAFGRRG